MKLLPRNRPLRYAFLAGLVCFAFVCVVGVMRWNIGRESAAKLQAVCDKLDREDPGWRFDDMLAARKAPPKERNAYEVMAKVTAAPDFKFTGSEPSLESWRLLPEAMPPEVADWVGQFVGDRRHCLALARTLADFPEGLHPITYSKDIIGTLLPTVQDSRDIAHHLQWECRAACQLGDFDTAIADIRAMRNLARSFGDEGMLIVFLVRVAILGVAVGNVQEMLSQGEPSEAGLALLQKEMEQELREEYFAKAIRWERGMTFTMMKFYGPQIHIANMKLFNGLVGGPGEEPNKLDAALLTLRYPPYREHDQATMLEQMNAAIEAGRLGSAERLQQMRSIDIESKVRRMKGYQAKTLLTDLLSSAVGKVATADTRFRSNLECTTAGIAAERFRQANKRWPDTLQELVPKYLAKAPTDGFTGKPAIYRKLEDGVVIYHLGDDGTDEGGDVLGKIDQTDPRGEWKTERGKDGGIRLWNPDKRGK